MISEKHSEAARRNLKIALAKRGEWRMEKHPCWKGGRRIGRDGYVYVRAPVPCGRIGYQLEHRVVMEKLIGRRLERRENVHHKNGIKTDNRPENLEVVLVDEHTRQHHRERGSPHAKLTPIQVLEIRRLYAGGGWRYKDLAERFSVVIPHIGRIITRKTWAHLPPENT